MRSRVVALVIVMAAASAVMAQPFVIEFDVAGLSCSRCAATATQALRGIKGVTAANVDIDTRRGRLEASRTVTADEIRRALGAYGFEARFAGDAVVEPLTAEERAALDIRVASRGEALDVRKHLARGKFTVFDFWAEWCGPCHLLTPKIERLVQERPDVALRTIDLQSWDSAAGKQATRDFKIPALPYVRVYGPDGKFIGDVVGNDIDAIQALVTPRSR